MDFLKRFGVGLKQCDSISDFVGEVVSRGLPPDLRVVDSAPTDTVVSIDGRDIVMFGSNNYLGLAGHEKVRRAVADAAMKYGNSSGGSRWVSGTTDIQVELERAVADFKGTEAAITFATGYMANLGAVAPLAGQMMIDDVLLYPKHAVVFSDELNHASIVDACRLVKARKVVYRHADADDLAAKMAKAPRKTRKIVITDGVFSMDGDTAPLDRICDVAERHDAMVYVDDAHGTGVLGDTGKGTAEHYGVEDRVDVFMGTFTKAFGGFGGFLAGSQALVDYLRMTARAYIFTAPIPPAVCAGLIESVRLAADPGLRDRLRANTKRFREGAEALDLPLLGHASAINPVVIGDETRAKDLSETLFRAGYFVPFVRYPAVAKGCARLRITMMASHSDEQIDGLLAALGEATG